MQNHKIPKCIFARNPMVTRNEKLKTYYIPIPQGFNYFEPFNYNLVLHYW